MSKNICKSKRVRLKDYEAQYLGLKLNKKMIGGVGSPTYSLNPDQIEQLESFRIHGTRGISESADEAKLDPTTIKHLWKKSENASVFVKNPLYIDAEALETKIKELDFESIFKEKIKPLELQTTKLQDGYFDRFVYTDVHVGMNPNPDGYSLYGGKWNEHELEERLKKCVSKIVDNQKANILYLDELGDFMDGWDGQTTRKGHDFPQNMDNQKAFDTGVLFKVRMIDELVKHYEKIICNNICVDNHAGSFGYVVNSAFKTIIELKYPNNVEVNNLRHFINHYKHGKFTFIITHGKDDKALKFGFKPILDPKQETKINGYIDEHFLHEENTIIEFSKGDSHQYLFDNSTGNKFNYYNYPALSPASNWVQTNFKKGESGAIFFNYFEEDEKKIHEISFPWKR